jgi:hypothetical protein
VLASEHRSRSPPRRDRAIRNRDKGMARIAMDGRRQRLSYPLSHDNRTVPGRRKEPALEQRPRIPYDPPAIDARGQPGPADSEAEGGHLTTQEPDSGC